jgi:hypothetical protein
LLHAPQLLTSVCSSTQPPPFSQYESPAAHVQAYTGIAMLPVFVHVEVPAQTVLQVPQLVLLTAMQAPLQGIWPEGQLVQMPCEQPSPVAHWWPAPLQLPQWLGSVSGLMHAFTGAGQSCGVAVGHVHMLVVHEAPAAHTLPHALQLLGSLVTSAHVPLPSAMGPGQAVSPFGQLHTPDTHTAPA